MIESSENKLIRYLTRVSYEEMKQRIRDVFNSKSKYKSTVDAYKESGWTRREFHLETINRARENE